MTEEGGGGGGVHTGVDQFEALPVVLRVGVELQPDVVGGGDQSQAQHGGAGEGPQDVGGVVPAVVDLHGRRFTVLGRAHRVDTLGG